MGTTIRYILITALRDWLFVGIFAAIFVGFGISIFLGGTALVEEASMRISYVAGSTRVILTIGLLAFVCFHVRNLFNNKEVEVILSRPISRHVFVISYWLGFSLIALLLIIPLTIMMSFLTLDFAGLLYWSLSVLLENLIVIAFALFASLIMSSAVSSLLLCFGFYFISRIMGFMLYIIESPHLFNNFDVDYVIGKLLVVVSAILPRLDLFGKSTWLVYGVGGDLNYEWFIPQTLIYVPFLLYMAILDFKRKQF